LITLEERAQSDTTDMKLAQLCRKLDAWEYLGWSIIEVIIQRVESSISENCVIMSDRRFFSAWSWHQCSWWPRRSSNIKDKWWQPNV